MSSAVPAGAVNNEDLDAFLTMLESKLRGPFSSLDLAKAVSTAALTSNDVAAQYLHNVCAVLPRAEKVTQLRILTGLLGLEPASDVDAAVQNIVETAQDAPVYEEWVRVIAGLVQRILFQNKTEGVDDAMEVDQSSFNGQEADQLLDKTCMEILDRVRKLEHETAVIDEDTEHRLGQSDSDPLLAPYRYAFLGPDLLQKVIPEVKRHDHFRVNESADILFMDAKLELEKAKEEQEHQQAGLLAKAGPAQVQAKEPDAPEFPGFRTSKPKPAAARPKSSMFMPAKPPAAIAAAAKRPLGMKPGASGLKPVVKPVLHQRKAGAAQALLAKGRRARLMKAGGGTVTTMAQTTAPTTALGRTAATAAANRTGNARSKMKMIDVAEVQGLETKKQEASVVAPPAKRGRKAQLLSGNKRSKPEPMTTETRNEKVSRFKKHDSATNGDPHTANSKPPPVVQAAAPAPAANPTEAAAAGALASAALTAYQARLAAQPQTPAARAGGTLQGSGIRQQDWRQLLKEKSNKLSDEDRLRVQQFFVNHFNPTPEHSTYKLKLHEERTADATTGEPVKETYYLELDYNNFTSQQSKKVKRYKD
jgi:hypothetical protein